MIFNLQGPSFSSRVPVRSPCRRSLWSRSCPGVAGGWDPASFRPSSLSPYLPLAFSPPLGLNRTSPSRRVLDSPSRLSSLLSPSFAPTPSSLSSTRTPLRPGNSKEGGPLCTQSTGFAAWKNRPLRDRLPQHRASSAYLSRERKREAAKYSREKSRRTRVLVPTTTRISKEFLLPLRKRDDRASTRREAMIFISMLIPVISHRRNSGVVAENCSLKPLKHMYITVRLILSRRLSCGT